MRFFLTILAVILLSGMTGNALLYPQSFIIRDYDVRVKLSRDSSFQVDETLMVRFLQPRHGIYRLIPYLFETGDDTNQWSRQMPSLFGESFEKLLYGVKVPGHENIVRRQVGYLNIRIGSREKVVQGDQEYRISYHVYGEIGRFNDREEFYFDLIGNNWDVPIERTSFRIELPADLKAGAGAVDFFTESEGMSGTDVEFDLPNPRTIVGVLNRKLKPYEGFTVKVSFPKDYFGKNPVLESWLSFVNNFYLFILPIVTLIIVLVWWFFGRDKVVRDEIRDVPFIIEETETGRYVEPAILKTRKAARPGKKVRPKRKRSARKVSVRRRPARASSKKTRKRR